MKDDDQEDPKRPVEEAQQEGQTLQPQPISQTEAEQDHVANDAPVADNQTDVQEVVTDSAFLNYFFSKKYRLRAAIALGALAAVGIIGGAVGGVMQIGSAVAAVAQATELIGKADVDPVVSEDEAPEDHSHMVLSEEDAGKLQKLMKSLPADRPFLKVLCEAILARNKFQHRKVIGLLPEDIASHFSDATKKEQLHGYKLRGGSLVVLKDYTAATEAYEKGLQLFPNDWGTKAGIAACYVAMKDFGKAIEIYNSLLGPSNTLPENEKQKFHLTNAYNSRGIAYMRLGEFDKAIADLEKAAHQVGLAESPDYQMQVTKAVAFNSLGATLIEWASSSTNDKAEIKTMLGKAVEELSKGIAVFKLEISTDLAVDNRNDLAMLYTNRAIAYAKLQQMKKANEDMAKAIDIRKSLIETGHAEYYADLLNGFCNLAIVCRDNQDPQGLLKACTEGLDVCVDLNESVVKVAAVRTLIDLHGMRANERLHNGRSKHASEDYERVLSLCQQLDKNKDASHKHYYADAANNIAWMCATSSVDKLRDGDRAVKLAKRACEIESSEWGFWDTLAAAYAERGDFADALKTAKYAMELREKDHKTFAVYSPQHDEEGSAPKDESREDDGVLEFDNDMEYLKKMIKLYEGEKPYRDIPETAPPKIDNPHPPSPFRVLDDDEANWVPRNVRPPQMARLTRASFARACGLWLQCEPSV